MLAIPSAYLDLFEQKKAFGHLATLMPDGSPQVTPIWFDYKDGRIRVNSAKGRTKSRNMKEGSRVALAIMDPDNPYRYIQIRGQIGRVTEEGTSAHIDSLAKKYLGQESIPTPGRERSVLFSRSSRRRLTPWANDFGRHVPCHQTDMELDGAPQPLAQTLSWADQPAPVDQWTIGAHSAALGRSAIRRAEPDVARIASGAPHSRMGTA